MYDFDRVYFAKVTLEFIHNVNFCMYQLGWNIYAKFVLRQN